MTTVILKILSVFNLDTSFSLLYNHLRLTSIEGSQVGTRLALIGMHEAAWCCGSKKTILDEPGESQ